MLVKIALRYENDHGYKQMKNAMIPKLSEKMIMGFAL